MVALARQMMGDMLKQLKACRAAIALTALLAMLVLAAVYLLARSSGHALDQLTRDPAAITKTPAYYGLLSNLTVLAWTTGAVICFFAFALCRRRLDLSASRFFFWAAMLTSLLTFDDLFMLHEAVLPELTGWPESVFTAAYPLFMLLFLAVFCRFILRTDWVLLAAALGCMAASVGMDVLFEFSESETFLEDGFKFAGTLMWAVYFGRAAMQRLSSAG